MGIFENRTKLQNNQKGVPVWFMRQAGRYHNHYQNIKKNSDFMTMCKTPQLARDVTMGPIEEFDFDAAILFSDLLFPLENLNFGLRYDPGPILSKKISSLESFKDISSQTKASSYYSFQKEACALLRECLPKEKTLLGFVGAPFTLYSYAVEGSHSGNLVESKLGLYDGRFEKFWEILYPELLEEMKCQAEGNCDAICIFDTAAGELSFSDYVQFVLPKLKTLTSSFKKLFPNKKVIYYSKFTHLEYLQAIEDDCIDALGIDWRMNLALTLKELGKDYYIQGNFDPALLHLPWDKLEKSLNSFYQNLTKKNLDLSRWICGLGHGVIKTTPQENVKKAIEYIHSNFKC